MTRFLFAGLALCWLAVGVSAWRSRRGDVARHGPVRWHRAVRTLEQWSDGSAVVPAAATWCRPVGQPVLRQPWVVPMRDLPRQRAEVATEPSTDAARSLSASPAR